MKSFRTEIILLLWNVSLVLCGVWLAPDAVFWEMNSWKKCLLLSAKKNSSNIQVNKYANDEYTDRTLLVGR